MRFERLTSPQHPLYKQALALLAADGLPVILEIDPPLDAVSIRRRGFYQRCGFKEAA